MGHLILILTDNFCCSRQVYNFNKSISSDFLFYFCLMYFHLSFHILPTWKPHCRSPLLCYHFLIFWITDRTVTASRWFSVSFVLLNSVVSAINLFYFCSLLFFSSPWFLSCWISFIYCLYRIILKYALSLHIYLMLFLYFQCYLIIIIFQCYLIVLFYYQWEQDWNPASINETTQSLINYLSS